MVNKINGTGIILPRKLKPVACSGDSPREIPTGIAPRNSMIGSAAVIKTVNSIEIN
jgi:hypothetical protein